jgi:hypothetical protein
MIAVKLGRAARRLRLQPSEPITPSSTLAKWKIDAGTLGNGPEIGAAIDRVLELLKDADRPQKSQGDDRPG